VRLSNRVTKEQKNSSRVTGLQSLAIILDHTLHDRSRVFANLPSLSKRYHIVGMSIPSENKDCGPLTSEGRPFI
jgi:hypothetical protein